MKLLEVKNDIAKIMYNPADNKLLPSDFILIEDSNQKLVAQILNIYTTEDSNNNIAEVRLALYIDKEDNISYYNGYIPSKDANLMYITSDEITEMIAGFEENIYLGSMTYHPKSIVKTPMSLINEKLYIQCDRDDNTKIIIQNIVSELYVKRRKIILLDFDGRYSRIANVPRIVVSESFKFPLNIDAFNNILDYDTVDCPLEDRAVIQGIVLELVDYLRTLENKFLPFTLFKSVVISEFSANPISGLMVLRNKLWQYAQDGLFAESKADFDIINNIMQNENFVIIDASKIEEKWHKFVIQTIPKIIDKQCYFAFSMNDIPMDKRSIISLYNNQNIIPIITTSYDCPQRNLLKSLSKNQILFRPSKKLEFDEKYASFISKLSNNDFILYGETSLNLPLIIDLKPFDVKTSEEISEQEIRRNVDKILSTGKSMLPKEAVITEKKEVKPAVQQYEVDDVTDEDLDFIDNIRPDNVSIDDLRQQKAEIEEKSKNNYNTFSPMQEEIAVINKPVPNENIQIKENITIHEDMSSKVEMKPVSEQEIIFNTQEVITPKEVETKQDNEQDFDFDDLLDNTTSNNSAIQFKNENEDKIIIKEEKENIVIKEEAPVIQFHDNSSEEIVEETVEKNKPKEKQSSKITIKQEDTSFDELLSEKQSPDIEEEQPEKKKKSEKKQRKAVAGYFKNEAEQMDFIPELPPIDDLGGLEYQEEEKTYDDDDYRMDENLDMQSVENLAPDDIQGLGFGGTNDDFIEFIEEDEDDEIIEEEDDIEDEKKDIQSANNSAYAEEKKNPEKILDEDIQVQEKVFSENIETSDLDTINNEEQIKQQDQENITEEIDFEEDSLENDNFEDNNVKDIEPIKQEVETFDEESFDEINKEEITENIQENVEVEEAEIINENESSFDSELFDSAIENVQSEEISEEAAATEEENKFIQEQTKQNIDLDNEMFNFEDSDKEEVNQNISLDDELFEAEEESKEDEKKKVKLNNDEYRETVITEKKPAQKKITKQKQSKKDNDEIVAIDNIIQNIKLNPEKQIQSHKQAQQKNNKINPERENMLKRKISKNTPPPPVQVMQDRAQKKVLTVYETDTSSDIVTEDNIPFKVGDKVYHPKHGNGVVEGFANYSNKILFCQIEFENVGRRILDPRVSGLEKIN